MVTSDHPVVGVRTETVLRTFIFFEDQPCPLSPFSSLPNPRLSLQVSKTLVSTLLAYYQSLSFSTLPSRCPVDESKVPIRTERPLWYW